MKMVFSRKLDNSGFHIHFLLPILAVAMVAIIGTILLGIDHAATITYNGACTGTTYSTTTTNTSATAISCITQAQDLMNGLQHQELATGHSYRIATSAGPGLFAYGSNYYLTMNGSYNAATVTAVQNLSGSASLTGGTASTAGWQELCQAAAQYGFAANSGVGASALNFETNGQKVAGQYTSSSLYTIFKSTCGIPAPPGAAPAAISISYPDSALNVDWQAVSGATEYQLQVTATGKAAATYTTQAIKGVIGYVTSGKTGTVRVRAGNTVGWGPWSAAKAYSFNECEIEGGNVVGSDSCYFWGEGIQSGITATGAQVTMSATAPKVSGTVDHSDSELYATGNGDTVEICAMVGPDSSTPFLRIGYWKQGAYVASTGFVAVSGAPIANNGNLPTTGTYTIMTEYVGSQWRVYYNGKEVGYYPESIWGTNAFTQITEVAIYGEVSADLNTPATGQMGNGQLGSSGSSAYFTNYSLIGSTATPKLSVAGPSGAAAKVYSVGYITPTSFHYGGPGF
jgi:hypothetical protein